MNIKGAGLIGLFATSVVLAACASPSRMGMVQQEGTGLQFGSAIARNFVTDASFYPNKKIKIRTRNTSGDTAFDLGGFAASLRAAFAAKGYQPTQDDDFGLLVDVNVMRSGQIQRNMSSEFGFLGGAAGGLTGAAASRGGSIETTAGTIAGATLGSIIGSYVTDDTYIIIAQVTFGEVKDVKKSKRRITFSRSAKTRYEDEDKDDQTRRKRGFRNSWVNRVAVFAGGRNVPQSRVAGEVRERMIRIVSDII